MCIRDRNVKTGERFTVMRVGRGGKRTPKGELNVIRVDKLVSHAEILSQDPNDPVIRDDVIWRQKEFEE